jgi:nuclear transport factor 2 (NTF2) superfamily protein
MSTRPPLPPFTHETAVLKVRLPKMGGILVILRK